MTYNKTTIAIAKANIKITQKTSTVLKLEIHNHAILWVLFVGLCILGGLILINSQRKVLECYRLKSKQINCEITSFNVLGQKVQIIPVKNLQGAELEKSSNKRKSRVVLNTKNSRIPLNYLTKDISKYSDNRIASQINSFIQKSEKSSF